VVGAVCGCATYVRELSYRTTQRFQVIRITSDVEGVVRESGIENGLVGIYAPHATAAIIINEYEPRIVSDYIEWVTKTIPPNASWRHNEIDDNAHAHIASAIIGTSRVLPLVNGRLVRGTWQEIMLLELDGPRYRRRVVVHVVGCR